MKSHRFVYPIVREVRRAGADAPTVRPPLPSQRFAVQASLLRGPLDDPR